MEIRQAAGGYDQQRQLLWRQDRLRYRWFLIGWMLAIAGYSAAAEIQPASVNVAIIGFSIYVPLLLFVGMFMLLKFYDLEAKYPQIIADLQARKESNTVK